MLSHASIFLARGVSFVFAGIQPSSFWRLKVRSRNKAAVTRVKIEHTYRLLCRGKELATAATTLVCLDGQGRPRAIPQVLHDT